MKKLSASWVLALLSCFLLLACSKAVDNSLSASETKIIKVKTYAQSPSWALTDVNGVVHDFPESAQGKTSIILFWASWCPYCKSLMPHIQSVLYEYADELDLQVLALSVFEEGDPQEYVTESGYDFVLFTEADAVAKLYQVHGTPGLFVIDREGQIRFDLSKVQSDHLKASGNKHWQKARKKAPYWAAELRKTLATL